MLLGLLWFFFHFPFMPWAMDWKKRRFVERVVKGIQGLLRRVLISSCYSEVGRNPIPNSCFSVSSQLCFLLLLLAAVMKDYSSPPLSAWDVNQPFVQCVHSAHLPGLLATQQLSESSNRLAQCCRAAIQAAVISFLNHGPKMQEGWCWQYQREAVKCFL